MSSLATAFASSPKFILPASPQFGEGTVIYPFASLGTPPQSVHYRGGATRLIVGPRCDIREGTTMNTGTEDGGGVTRVGERCFFMVGSHVAHDCQIGNQVTFANNVTLGGHVTIGDGAFLAVSLPCTSTAVWAKAP